MCRLGIAVADTGAVQELDVEEPGAQPPLITQGIDSGGGAGTPCVHLRTLKACCAFSHGASV